MFNGNINNKHYEDPSEYYRDLNELSQKGESFTASCSYSTESPCEKKECCKSEKQTCLKDTSAASEFIENFIPDYEDVYKDFLKSKKDKENYIQIKENDIPYGIIEKIIGDLEPNEIEFIRSYIESKKDELESLKENYEYQIETIDNNYAIWNSKRMAAYNTLKGLNDKIENLAKERDQYDDTYSIIKFVDGFYDNVDSMLKGSTVENCKSMCNDEKKEEAENDEPNAEEAIQSILSVFTDLFC